MVSDRFLEIGRMMIHDVQHEGLFHTCSELSKRVRSPIEHILGYQRSFSVSFPT